MRLVSPVEVPKKIIVTSCSHCGDEEKTINISIYREVNLVFVKALYPDLSIYLCKKCLEQALALFDKGINL